MFVHHIIPESVHLLQRDGLHEEGEVRLAQYLPAVVVVAGHLALEADDMLLCSLRTVKLLQILVDAVEQVRVITLESPRWMQDILDDLFHPLAVSLLREGLFRSLDDGGDLFGYPFLFNGRHGSRSPVT